MPSFLSRRTFIGLAVTFGGGALGVLFGVRHHARARNRSVLRLAASVANFEDARALGRAYLAGQPEEADLTVLAELVAADLNLVPYGLDDVELHERFRGRVTQDFEDANIIMLQGWILSRTELRLCGLATLVLEQGQATLEGS